MAALVDHVKMIIDCYEKIDLERFSVFCNRFENVLSSSKFKKEEEISSYFFKDSSLRDDSLVSYLPSDFFGSIETTAIVIR